MTDRRNSACSVAPNSLHLHQSIHSGGQLAIKLVDDLFCCLMKHPCTSIETQTSPPASATLTLQALAQPF